MLYFAMLFNVSGLIQDGIGATRQHRVEGTLHIEGREPERVTGSVELLRTRSVLARVHLAVAEHETCARCLRVLEKDLPIDFEEEFLPTLDPHSDGPLREPVDPDAFRFDENNMLDLTEAVRQYREASEEIAPLCRPDCRGLCPDCGADLNQGPCGCDTSVTDARWEGLKALRSAISEGKE